MEKTSQSNSEHERDYQHYSQLLELWSRENSIKTQKLQYFLLTNALLAIGYALTSNMTLESLLAASKQAVIPFFGSALSLIWLLSIGRTVLFQKRWQAQLRELSGKYPNDNRFQILNPYPAPNSINLLARIAGSISSKYYLIGAPLLALFYWLWSSYELL